MVGISSTGRPCPYTCVRKWTVNHPLQRLVAKYTGNVCSVVSDFFGTPWTVALQAPLFMGFSRQEYESELPFPPPGDLSDPGIEPMSPESPTLEDGFFTTEPPENPK